MANAINQETQKVMDSIHGVKTNEDRICEYFGIQASDLGKTVKLKKA